LHQRYKPIFFYHLVKKKLTKGETRIFL
jgi:hypothetical protein